MQPTITLNLEYIAQDINEAHDRAIERLIDVGHMLTDAHAELGDITFKRLCDEYLRFSRRSAYNYMRLYEHSLVQPLHMLQKAVVSVWYHVAPDNSDVVEAIKQKLANGEKVTVSEAKALASQVMPLNDDVTESAEQSPTETANALLVGALVDLDGNAKPLEDANSTDWQLNTLDDVYERFQRQQDHIAGKRKRSKVDTTLHSIVDVHGEIWLAVNSLPIDMNGKEVTIYYEGDDSNE